MNDTTYKGPRFGVIICDNNYFPRRAPTTITRMYCHACDVSTSVVGHVSYGSLDTGMQECDTCRGELACYVICGNREIELG